MTTSEGLGARESNSGGGEIFRIRTDRPWWLPNLLYNGYRVFPEGKAAVAGLWPPPPLAPRLKKSRVVPLLPLWAFVAYSSVNFIFMPFPFVPWALTMSCFFISIKFNGHLLTFKLKAPMPITKRAQRHK